MPTIDAFLERILSAATRDDRGYLATLRRGLSDTTQEQAWPLVIPWCARFEDVANRKIWCTIGGVAALLFPAKLGIETYASLGSVMRKLATGTAVQDGILSYEAKFRRILNSPDAVDLCNLVVGIVRTAERKGIPINCKSLFWDLLSWIDHNKREDVRVRWAQDFYRASKPEEMVPTGTEGLA